VVASTGDPRARDDWQLVISAAAGVVRRHIQPGAEIVIGRGDHVDVDVHDESVSRRHARLRVGDPLRIEDLGSRNGTFVAGRRLAAGEAVTVPLGAVIELGSTFLVVHRGSLVNGLAANPPSAEMLVVGETMQRLYGLLDTIAPSTLRVLILGETGTGKEVYARAVHARSDRAARPFIALNCASLVESLLESELFGHEKGAFTGAVVQRIGRFELAHRGTIFLDEIGEAPLELQPKLLRVLQEREFERLGGSRTLRSDARLIAATNRDLAQLVEQQKFRSDLFYRLNVFPVHVPPLRERAGDIPLLVEHFRRRVAREHGVEPPEISPQGLARMMEHPWPGNVRELENFVERAAILHAGAATLPFEPPRGTRAEPERDLAGRARRERWTLERLEREHVLQVLEDTGGNQVRAAEVLGIDRRTLHRKLRAYSLDHI